ncbi:unnamed protein product, partial [Polarella glacialis]
KQTAKDHEKQTTTNKQLLNFSIYCSAHFSSYSLICSGMRSSKKRAAIVVIVATVLFLLLLLWSGSRPNVHSFNAQSTWKVFRVLVHANSQPNLCLTCCCCCCCCCCYC